MSSILRRLLKIIVVFYLLFLAFVMHFLWKLPSQGDFEERVLIADTTLMHSKKSGPISNTEPVPLCDKDFVGYNNTFAKLRNVVIDPSKSEGRHGGENISDVINQPENSEYLRLKEGYFNIKCHGNVSYSFHGGTHLRSWLESLQISATKFAFDNVVKGWTIAVRRIEYVNLYHTMADYYNAFLVSRVFNMPTGNNTILWIDGHPAGTLDLPWKVLFGKTIRAGDIRTPVMFEKMVWGIMGNDSPIKKHSSPSLPYINEFKGFVLSRYGVDTTDRKQNCSQLNITFVWRRDYVAHPRNPSGSVSRKIKNEGELLSSATKTFPNDSIVGVQLDLLSMKDQLSLISQTDVLVGMHGAGLSHTLFLPNNAGLIELYPTYWSNANIPFKTMAKWRQLHYMSWVNVDKTRELDGHYTVVDTNAIINLMEQTKRILCH